MHFVISPFKMNLINDQNNPNVATETFTETFEEIDKLFSCFSNGKCSYLKIHMQNFERQFFTEAESLHPDSQFVQ